MPAYAINWADDAEADEGYTKPKRATATRTKSVPLSIPVRKPPYLPDDDDLTPPLPQRQKSFAPPSVACDAEPSSAAPPLSPLTTPPAPDPTVVAEPPPSPDPPAPKRKRKQAAQPSQVVKPSQP